MQKVNFRHRLEIRPIAVFLGLASYLISTSAVANALPQQLAQGQLESVAGEINEQSYISANGARINVHTFEGTEGDTFVIEMTSTDFDSSIILVGPDGSSIAQNDDRTDIDSLDSQIILKLPYTGTYQIFAQANSPGAMGQYNLNWRKLTPSEIEQSDIPPGNYIRIEDYSDPPDYIAGTEATALSFTDVIPLAEEQLKIARQQLGDKHPDVAEQLGGLGTLYLLQNRYEDANLVLTEALNIYRAYPGEYDSEIAWVLDILSGVAYRDEQTDAAVAISQEALDIRREIPGGVSTTANLDLLAYSLQAQGRYDEAEKLLIENIDLGQPSEPLDVAFAIDALASLYYLQERYVEAEEQYRKALEVRQGLSIDEFEHPSLSTSLNNLALLYQTQGRYAEAEPLYQQALDIYNTYLDYISHPGPELDNFASSLQAYTLPILYNLTGLYRTTNNIQKALATLRMGLAIEDREFDFNLENLGDSDRQSYAAAVKSTLNYVLSLHLDSAPESMEAAEIALTTVLRRKGRILEAGTRALEVIRRYGTPEDQDLLRQFIKLKQKIANLTSQPPSELSSSEYQTQLAGLRSESNQLEAILSRRSALLAPETPPVKLSTVQKHIPADGVLVEYVLYQPFDPSRPIGERFSAELDGAAQRFEAPRYVAYLFFPNGTIEAVDLGEAEEIDRAIQSFGNLLKSVNTDFSRATVRVEIADEYVDDIANNIRALVFDPIAPYIQDQKHLLISPDSQLNRLPFEALQIDDKRFLVEQYQISYLNSGRDLLKLDNNNVSNSTDVILANPNYGGSALANNLGSEGLDSLGHVAPLPGTAAEIASIAPLLSNATFLTEENATETALKAVQSPRILHLATHGFFLPDVERPDYHANIGLLASNGPIVTATATGQTIEDPLLRSGLALAGFNPRTSGDDDGVFTALEAANLNLTGTQLVVLSACDTGLGDIASGEGVYGLRRAFSIAGAETQLMSLWQVSDVGTQSLMTNYYENLTSGMGRSEALRTAQLEMINSNSDYAHPYYWAAFILSGDWRPLE